MRISNVQIFLPSVFSYLCRIKKMAADNSRVKLKVIVDNTKSSSEDESESDTEDSSSSSSSSGSSHGSQSDSDDKSDITEVDTVVVAADNNDRIKAPKNV